MKQAQHAERMEYIRGYPGVGALTQSGPSFVPTMVASEPVGPDDELPPYSPTEKEAESAPTRVCIRPNVETRKYDFT